MSLFYFFTASLIAGGSQTPSLNFAENDKLINWSHNYVSESSLAAYAESVYSDSPPHKIDEQINTAIEDQIIEQVNGGNNRNCDELIDEVVVNSQPEEVQVMKYKVTQYVTVYTNMKFGLHFDSLL